jgi:hypothetical protein
VANIPTAGDKPEACARRLNQGRRFAGFADFEETDGQQ